MGGAQVRRLGSVAALVVIFVVGLLTAAPQARADAGPAALPTVLCPMQVPGHPHGYSADPEPPAQWAPESGVDVPPGAVAFASPDPSAQITYTISPPGYRCDAHGNYSSSSGPVPQRVSVYSPGDAVPVWDIGADTGDGPDSARCSVRLVSHFADLAEDLWVPARRMRPSAAGAVVGAHKTLYENLRQRDGRGHH